MSVAPTVAPPMAELDRTCAGDDPAHRRVRCGSAAGAPRLRIGRCPDRGGRPVRHSTTGPLGRLRNEGRGLIRRADSPAEGDMSVGWVYGVLGVHPWLMGLMDERAVRDVWGDDDSVRLCSSLMPVGKAEKVDGGFKLSGHWRFSSGCHYAQWALLGGAVQGVRRRCARHQVVHGSASRISDR